MLRMLSAFGLMSERTTGKRRASGALCRSIAPALSCPWSRVPAFDLWRGQSALADNYRITAAERKSLQDKDIPRWLRSSRRLSLSDCVSGEASRRTAGALAQEVTGSGLGAPSPGAGTKCSSDPSTNSPDFAGLFWPSPAFAPGGVWLAAAGFRRLAGEIARPGGVAALVWANVGRNVVGCQRRSIDALQRRRNAWAIDSGWRSCGNGA
jgi:hypothetical protein